MDSFKQGLHNMFDHIWDCKIEHPIFEDTVGELMQAVMQLYDTTTQQKVGQWIEHKTDDGRSWLECPICHIKKQYPITNYCPKCGSRNTEKDIPDEDGWVW